jgi:predicted  nucleic acid-binding Zn-ribbon protein|tara:strand:- start:241 stop:492 length:252 start_codon:yes stop_codon:yes gene_type:complete
MEEAKKMITEEQLKTVSDQQSKLSALLRNIGVVEVQKQNIHSQITEISKEIEASKKELEDEYGQVNIDLTDGSYTEIEKEDAE